MATRTITIRVPETTVRAFQQEGKAGYSTRMARALEAYLEADGLAGLIARKLLEQERERQESRQEQSAGQ